MRRYDINETPKYGTSETNITLNAILEFLEKNNGCDIEDIYKHMGDNYNRISLRKDISRLCEYGDVILYKDNDKTKVYINDSINDSEKNDLSLVIDIIKKTQQRRTK